MGERGAGGHLKGSGVVQERECVMDMAMPGLWGGGRVIYKQLVGWPRNRRHIVGRKGLVGWWAGGSQTSFVQNRIIGRDQQNTATPNGAKSTLHYLVKGVLTLCGLRRGKREVPREK